MNAKIAMPDARRFSLSLNEGEMTGWRWPNAHGRPLLFLHATGFCASAYAQMLSAVQDVFDVYALDLRGHGRNSLPADPARLRSWAPYRDDVRAFLDKENRDGWVLAGHSLGAATALLAAEGRSDVAALRLIEPVAMPSWLSALAKTPVWPVFARRMPLVRGASRRRSLWLSREEVAASYGRKSLFRDWAPGVLDDYLRDGLTEENGGVRLSCAPAWEAATFAAQGNDFWKAAANAPAPVRIFAAREGASTAPAFARARFRTYGADVVVDDGAGHLAPMHKPPELAAFLAS
ncbi:alpha/beta fold hydrolase [Hyphococcus sp.]|uniref:alpha/beta fold hydrolase n=1 Tax=Hyphococcus sp. TaxID=2038636 RepID=UPI003D0D878B